MAEFERTYSCSYSSSVSTHQKSLQASTEEEEEEVEAEGPAFVVDGTIDYSQTGIKQAMKDVAKLAVPITMTALFISFILAINLIWIGHHSNSNQFAGAALGNMLVNVMGNSVVVGMSSGLDTQCGQAWGAGIKPMVGIFTQRSVLIGHIVVFCISILFWFGQQILLALGQQHDNAKYAGDYTKIFILALWPIAMFGNLRRFLQAQRKVLFIPVAVFLALCAQVMALEVFVSVLKWEYIGACFALPVSYWVMFLSLFLFTLGKGLHKECWPGWSKYSLTEWSGFLKLSIPGTLMLCSEWWAFEVLALVAAKFGTNYVSAFTVTLNALGLFLRIPLGISFACAVLVSNKLGSKFGQSARIAWDTSVFFSMSSAIVCGLLLFFLPEKMARLYTNQEDVVSIIKDTLPWVAVYFVIDSFQRIGAGACRGMGRQYFGAMTYIISYYFCGMPVGIYFGLNGFMGDGNPMHLKGLWLGSTISVIISAIFFLVLRLRVNWEKEVDRAQFRLEQERKQVEKFKLKAQEDISDISADSSNRPKNVTSGQTTVQGPTQYVMYDSDANDKNNFSTPKGDYGKSPKVLLKTPRRDDRNTTGNNNSNSQANNNTSTNKKPTKKKEWQPLLNNND